MKRIHSTIVALAVATVASTVSAASPYAGGQNTDIKALSAAEQASLLDGQGMGFAKAAELNGYPGPKHVLELSEQLSLSQAQRAATQALFERMLAAARADGQALVEAERSLDQLYAGKSATTASVNAQLAKIETLRARLRGIHLNAHLEQAALLSQHQIALYAQLRGYGRHQH
jgi:Spy/CpxP family protein refolding chaperone